MKKIIIVVDLGHFKAYRISRGAMESPKIELIGSYDNIEAHGRMSDKLSDAAGKFGMSGGKGGAATGSGEAHNLGLETQKRQVKMIANDIAALIKGEHCKKWGLAASKTINAQIIENLEPGIKAGLDKNIAADLTGMSKTEILKHFS